MCWETLCCMLKIDTRMTYKGDETGYDDIHFIDKTDKHSVDRSY
jgi:hypothetical protein